MVTSAGPLAMISCEPRQARKGATVVIDLCAGMWLVGPPPNLAFLHVFIPSVLYSYVFIGVSSVYVRCPLVYPSLLD